MSFFPGGLLRYANELLYLLIEGTKIEDSYLTFMRNCILGGDNFRAFRVDLGGQNSKGDNFQLYLILIVTFTKDLN